MNLLSKLIFFWRRPKIIFVIGKEKSSTAEAIYQVLRQSYRVNKLTEFPRSLKFRQILMSEVLIFEFEIKKAIEKTKDFDFFIKRSKLSILVITQIGEITSDRDFSAREEKEIEEILKLAKVLPSQCYLILNFDDGTVRKIRNEINLKILTFGFQEGADFRVSDIKLNTGTNFKLNYQGNIVPFWLEGVFSKEYIYDTLAAAAIGVIFELNLVEISQSLKNYSAEGDIKK